MKKILSILFCVTFFASCQNEIIDTPTESKGKYDFMATIEGNVASTGNVTRSLSTSSNDVVWSVNDKISIFTQTTDNREYQIKSGQGTSSAVFEYISHSESGDTETLASNFAVYPYNQDNSYSDGVIYARLNPVQVFENNSIPNESSIMVAKSGDKNLSFKNAVGIFRLKIRATNNTLTYINSIEVCSQSELMSGNVKIDMSKDAPVAEVEDMGEHSITLSCTTPVQLASEYSNFNIIVPVGEYAESDLSLKLHLSVNNKEDEKSVSLMRSMSIHRSSITSVYLDVTDYGVNVDYTGNDNESFTDLESEGNYNTPSLWINKGISYTNGSTWNAQNRLSTISYLPSNVDIIYVPNPYRAYLFAYQNDVYKGVWDGEKFSTSSLTDMRGVFYLNNIKKANKNYQYKLVLYKKDGSNISVAESANVELYNSSYFYNVYLTQRNETNPSLITFIDDDGFSEAIDNWEEMYNLCGITPTIATITSFVGNDGFMTWDKVNELKQKGFEFVSHTNTHQKVTNMSLTQLQDDLSRSINTLKQHDCTSDFLVYPYNAHSASTDALTSQMFKLCFAENDSVNVRPINPTAVSRFTILSNSKSRTITLQDGSKYNVLDLKDDDEFHAIVDETIIKGGWTVFMSHFRNSYTDRYHFNQTMRDGVVRLYRYIQERGVKVAGVSTGYEMFVEN